MTISLYTQKEGGYFEAVRVDLLEMLPREGGLRILEIGAGKGATLQAAKERGLATYTAGIELMMPDNYVAGAGGIDLFLTGDFEAMNLDLLGGSFDAVICADVIEHLRDPWTSVRRMSNLLRPGGVLLTSIPNFRNFRALCPILFQGDFRYSGAGLLDKSHLRFFCRTNVRHLFEQAGLVVETMETNMGGYGLRHRAFDLVTLGLFHDFFVFQFRTRARKAKMEESV